MVLRMNSMIHCVFGGPPRECSCVRWNRTLDRFRVLLDLGILLVALGTWQFGWTTESRAQPERPEARSSTASETQARLQSARGPYQQFCQRCHGADGTGGQARALMRQIPSFTETRWQRRRSDAQLIANIINGRGTTMPAFGSKLSQEQARNLVALVRAFAPKDKSREEKPPDQFETRFRQLEEEWTELRRKYREISDAPAPATHAPPAEAVPVRARTELYQNLCQRCHGEDGVGRKGRDLMPELPDFTDVRWQQRRTDEQLHASVLDGKGPSMPPFRHKVNEQEGRDLVALVRAFAAAVNTPNETSPDAIPHDSNSLPESLPECSEKRSESSAGQQSLADKVVTWLGRFHPATTHFPIGLLVGAAGAGVLFLVTGRPLFDAAARFCIWFGVLSAFPTVLLGWLLAGPHLTDANSIMTTHRWLGTATAILAALVLIAGECQRRSDNRRRRVWLHLTLMLSAAAVLATGFFGGALIHGLDHYAWPQ